MTVTPRSLLGRVASGLIAVSLLAILAAGALLYLQFSDLDTPIREHTLQSEARMLGGALIAHDQEVSIPAGIASVLERSGERFAILDGSGAVLLGSAGVAEPLHPIGDDSDRGFFAARRGGRTVYGTTRRASLAGKAIWIQVESSNRETSLDSVVREYVEHLAWIWIPFIIALLAINLVLIYRGLGPLRIASARAGAIGPETASIRLPETGMATEILPLVVAVNRAFDRLEAGYEAQRSFIADAAHELRTPLAVLKAHLAVLEDSKAVASLQLDVEAMERLVGQLLDLARLDVLRLRPRDRADLSRLAVEVATHLAPLAVARGRSIEVIGGDRPVLVHGASDYLFRAFRNLVENALTHTPAGTTVTIAVAEPPALTVTDRGSGIAPERRKAIFERFWRGDQDRSGGVGLGLAIVARTIAAHEGTIEVDDAPGGGARISVHFPELKIRTDDETPESRREHPTPPDQRIERVRPSSTKSRMPMVQR